MLGTYLWVGQVFEIFPFNANWPAGGGVYIFARKEPTSGYHAVYVGETGNFSNRLSSHERRYEAHRLGASYVHLKMLNDERRRKQLEDDLIRFLGPDLND